MIDKLIKIRKGGDVKRFHTVTMHREHLVSSHSWGVATLLLYIYPQASRELIMSALWHDVAEAHTGDMPATTKWANPVLAAALAEVEARANTDLGLDVELSEDDTRMLKFADMAELILSCMQEYELGNVEGLRIAKLGVSHLTGKGFPARCRPFFECMRDYVASAGE